MDKIGLFFGTSTGTTRLIAKKLAKKLGEEICDKPLNINRTNFQQLASYQALILGTPTYADGRLPGIDTGVQDGSWQEALDALHRLDFSGKTVALFGLGNQEKYPERFADGLGELYHLCFARGARLIGQWPTEGYTFQRSRAVIGGKLAGLALDNNSQGLLTEQRLDAWVKAIRPQLVQAITRPRASVA